MILLGDTYSYTNAKDAMVTALRVLAKADRTFLLRCSQHLNAQGRKRHYIALTEEELYPDRPDLRHMNERLLDGWLVATNVNNGIKKTIIRLAAEVAGITFGKDLVIEL